MNHRERVMTAILIVLVASTASAVEMLNIPHPYLLWSKEELAAIRERVKTDPQAKQQVDLMLRIEKRGPKDGGGNPPMLNLFKYAVLGDQAAGQIEKQALLGFVNFKMPEAKPGNPETGNAPWREDHTLDALRYDILYAELSDEQRKGIEDAARALVDWCIAHPGPWSNSGPTDAGAVNASGSAKRKTRSGWLPNMQWPTMAGAHVFAAAIGDADAIQRIAGCEGGWKWYFDGYIADGRFYMEEFAKYGSNIGSMILWCDGLERLGMGKLGWGYTGAGGATMRRFLGCLMDAALPGLPRGGAEGTWNIPAVFMGDAGRMWVVFGDRDSFGNWGQARMQGAIAKMKNPLWWEAGHRRFPDAGFDYFLAQMRAPGEAVYLPTLYFGLGPIDPAKVKAPPASSFITPERGFAMLRIEESPAYWESPKPAVALQFGMYYVHYVHDCFSILDYVAYNRNIYDKIGHYGTHGYAGGDFWRDHGRGQASAVVVDELQVQPVDNGEDGCRNQRLRSQLSGPAKFAAVRAKGAFKPKAEDVDMERALVLTADYLVDATWLSGSANHVYDWHVQSPGAIPAGHAAAWKNVAEFAGGKIRDQELARQHLDDAKARDAGAETWNATILLQHAEAPADGADVVGVRVTMLGEEGTALVAGRPPSIATNALGLKLMATRTARTTCFAAVHEPFKGGANRIERVSRLGKAADGVGMVVVGKAGSGIDDRILIRAGDAVGTAVTFSGDGESYTTADEVWLRIGPDRIEAWGDLRSVNLKTAGAKRLMVNGAEKAARTVGGTLSWTAE